MTKLVVSDRQIQAEKGGVGWEGDKEKKLKWCKIIHF